MYINIDVKFCLYRIPVYSRFSLDRYHLKNCQKSLKISKSVNRRRTNKQPKEKGY